MKNKILITGITGQLGSYLAEKYLDMDYEVHGIIRRSSSFNTGRIDHIFNKLNLYHGEITDPLSTDNIIHGVKPDLLINCGAQSHVAVSFNLPLYTAQVDGLGVLSILESVRKHCSECRVVQLSTSELFGEVLEMPQTEKTPFNPLSPYAAAKQYAFFITKYFRKSYGMFVSNAICFNMESERRGRTFVTKKITDALSKIVNNKIYHFEIGNLDAKRDWGYCPEYADGIIKISQHSEPDDFVLATNETHSIREFINEAITYTDIKLEWSGTGVTEVGIDTRTGKNIIRVNPKYFRPNEVDILLGDYTKAKTVLGWEPKTKFKDLVKIMMVDDLKNSNSFTSI